MRVVALGAAALVLAGCGSKQDALAAHSSAAHGISSLWWNMLIGSSLAFGIVACVLGMAWIRRRRPGVPGVRDGDRVAWGVVLGLGIAVPILTISALFFYSDIFLIRQTGVPTANAAPADRVKLKVRVIGHQFWWEIRYPGTPVVTANELHIPVRTNVEVLLSTRDVIHSLWVPELNKKTDLIPDQVNTLLLYADKPGRYRGQCAEFCGLQHAHMGIYVFAQPAAAFHRWLAAQARPATRASALFDAKCGSCHQIRGTPAGSHVGPDLTHVGSRSSLAALTIANSPARMREWIHDPQRVKPGSAMPAVPLTNVQVNELASYLEGLR
ncbi:MAG TPA: c-type cytochrome [Gaiellaceae bacterium]|nr:c-type cytochrome [Gaiellaceae bacterium]